MANTKWTCHKEWGFASNNITENDITVYKMKHKEVNICLRKAKLKYYQNLLDEKFQSLGRF